MKRRMLFAGLVLVLFQILVAGCASTGDVAENGKVADKEKISEKEEPADIRWLTSQLHDEGVFVVERGSPNPAISSDKSSRLILNQREVLDVFNFDSLERARIIATEFASHYPQNDVYRKDSLVVVRYSRRDTGLNHLLFKLLGAAV